MFEEGDLLFIPAWWLHAIETAPADNGWWMSLNRFHAVGFLPERAIGFNEIA